MFEGRFLELALIFVVALVVLGPTRLPGLVRTFGRWVGKARAMARDFQQQLENEVQLDELKRITEAQTRPQPTAAPVAPPEIAASAMPEPPPPAPMESAADSGYPYGLPAGGPESGAGAPAAPSPGDDTYSHAHPPGQVMAVPDATAPDAGKKDHAAA